MRIDKIEGVFDFNVACVFAGKFSGYLPGNFWNRLYRKDIERLIFYFENHMQTLASRSAISSAGYMPLECGMQIECLEGEAIDWSDGHFSMRVLFNCGSPDGESSNVSFGFETIVDFVDLNRFCDELRRFVA
ncbi:hypothetical protein [Pseudomonas asplenii]|uniref:hypothetical protein n=1 Tax=Pseudomonas asplenii TaxID=53407 RepID=UPI00128F5507|nr:hypothetical protein [Pseudomonas fuscovaginae]